MVLVHFTRRRKDLPFSWMFWMFAVFIISCGSTHLMEVVTTHVPVYRLAGLVKVVTAVASLSTAVLLIPLVPRALALRSPRELEQEIEERKQAQRELEAQSRQLREQALLLDLVHDSIFVRDLDDRITFWSQGAVEQYGWSKAEAAGQVTHTLLQTVFPEPLADVQARLLREGRWEGELTHCRRDGSRMVVASRWALQRDENGRPAGVLEINNDVTARKQAEAALQQVNAELEERVAQRTADLAVAKAHLEAIFNSVRDGIAVFDGQANVVFCNTAEARMVGFASPEEMLRSLSFFADIFELTDADGAVVPVDQWPVSRVLRGEEVSDWPCHGRRKDTGQGWDFSFSGSPVKDDSGRQVLSVIVTRDITAARAAERALRQSEHELGQTFEMSAVGIAQVALDGRWGRVNRRLCEIVGYRREEMVGLTFQDITHPDDLEVDLGQARRLLAGAINTYALEKRYLRKDSSVVWVNLTVSLVRQPSGEPHYFISVIEDISRRKELEAEVKRHAVELEERVAQRTQQLQEANAALEASNEALEAFGYSVSHDLRTPLRNMQSLAQVLEEDYGDRLDASGIDFCRRISAAARKMDTLIHDLLTYSRLSRSDLPLGRVDLSGVLAEVQASLGGVVQESQAEVAVEGRLPAVRAHRPTLVQVLTNLLSNALKFVARGVQPRVRTWTEDRGRWVRLWVEDNGIGIDAKHQQRIFSVFERLHSEESYPGTGIGLAIVRKGVERAGGQVGVESEVGRGSRFWVELPKAGEST